MSSSEIKCDVIFLNAESVPNARRTGTHTVIGPKCNFDIALAPAVLQQLEHFKRGAYILVESGHNGEPRYVARHVVSLPEDAFAMKRERYPPVTVEGDSLLRRDEQLFRSAFPQAIQLGLRCGETRRARIHLGSAGR